MNIKLSFTGDIFLSDQPHMIGLGVKSYAKKTRVKDYPFNKLKDHLKKSDIVFGNLESSFKNKTSIPKGFSIDQRSIIPLINANYNVLNIANNHILEHGKEGFLYTNKILKAFKIKIIGQRDNKGKYFTKPLLIRKNNRKIVFLGYSFISEGLKNIFLYSLANKKVIISDIEKVKQEKKPDLIIISIHWGDEYICIPSKENVIIGRELIDAGADLIIGHHPHVICPIEKYKNSYIMYSLGNFVFDMNYPLTNYGLLVDVLFSDKNLELKPNIVQIQKNWIPKIKMRNFKELIYPSKKIDHIVQNTNKYYKILSINRKNYRNSFYKLVLKNFIKNPYIIIPLFSRTIKNRIFPFVESLFNK